MAEGSARYSFYFCDGRNAQSAIVALISDADHGVFIMKILYMSIYINILREYLLGENLQRKWVFIKYSFNYK